MARKISHANRGMAFESLLEHVHDKYQKRGVAVVHKVPTEFIPLRNYAGKIIGCKVEKKSCADYIGRYKNIPVVVEAKSVRDNRITYNEVHDHQAKFINDFCGNGEGRGIILVDFSESRYYAIPWEYWKAAYNAWNERIDKSKRKCEIRKVIWKGKEYMTNGQGGISYKDIPDEWKINPGGVFILPYLSILEGEKNEK